MTFPIILSQGSISQNVIQYFIQYMINTVWTTCCILYIISF